MTNRNHQHGVDTFDAHVKLIRIRTVGMQRQQKMLFYQGYLSAMLASAIADMGVDDFGEVINPVMDGLQQMVAVEERRLETGDEVPAAEQPQLPQ